MQNSFILKNTQTKMDKIKKIFLIQIPLSICNFRCHYCYLSHHDSKYEGYQPKTRVTPEEFGKCFAMERIGGPAFANFCANGETLLTTDIEKYVKAYVEQGHYAEVVTNLIPTKVLAKFLAFDKAILKRIEFKCSFHYLELKKRNLLEVFASNVKKIWDAGCSANIEITPSDELIPYIDELKEFSMKHFGALPHVTVARDEKTAEMINLTHLSKDEYKAAWAQFDSEFWRFKYSIFGKPQKSFCYAGQWGYTMNFETGDLRQCYVGKVIGNLYDDPSSPLPMNPIGHCLEPHCHNGHALMSLGYIPCAYSALYGNMRDRVTQDGSHWLKPEILNFFNTKLEESNEQISKSQQMVVRVKSIPMQLKLRSSQMLKSVLPKSAVNSLRKIYHKINEK